MMQADAVPSVSVLLPFHNAAETTGDCVESILAQTLTDFEIIAVNDFSDDATISVLQQHQDERLKIIDNRHRGLVSALNTGLAFCAAPLVARMDADDIMH
ncbi:MAG: glycosyltransferase, partial [Gammaproteobacteria bacterium]|nr:glycosyltransferase [Gammaproteobacteria bacterium]